MTDRLYYLDWLRIIAVGAVFLVHCLLPFAGGVWIVTNAEVSTLAVFLSGIFNQFGIPLLFLLSGAGVWFALENRTARQFVSDRIQRLGIPFIFGIVIFSPVQAYFHDRANDEFASTLLHHYIPLFFRSNRFTSRDFQWVGSYGYHLWFLFFLLIFSLLALSLFIYFRRKPPVIRAINQLMLIRGSTLLLVIPLLLLQAILRPRFPEYLGWADFSLWFTIFVIGYILASDRRHMDAVRRDLSLAVATFVISAGMIGGIYIREIGTSLNDVAAYYPNALLLVFSITLNSWALLLILLGSAHRWLNINHRVLKSLNEMALPFYLLHHIPVVVIGFFAIRWNISSGVKFLAITGGSLTIALALYHLVIKRINTIRFLMGMRTLP